MTSDPYPILYNAIQRTLHYEWDPIGIQELDGAQNEYISYVPSIIRMLNNQSSVDEIFAYLWDIETDRMGLRGDSRNTRRVAGILHRLSADFKSE